jgi:hypothetical protein
MSRLCCIQFILWSCCVYNSRWKILQGMALGLYIGDRGFAVQSLWKDTVANNSNISRSEPPFTYKNPEQLYLALEILVFNGISTKIRDIKHLITGHLSVLWDWAFTSSEYRNSPFQNLWIHLSYIGIRDCSLNMSNLHIRNKLA